MLCELRDLDRLIGVVRFTEYQFNWPERICVDSVLNARDGGATVLNHVEAKQIRRGTGGNWIIELQDARTGTQRIVETRSIVNAAGVWVDQLAAGGDLRAPALNQGAKGTNVMVRVPEVFRGKGLQTLTRQGAPFYVIPLDDLHYFGPRNMPHDGSPSGFLAAEDEIAELIEEMNILFPTLHLTRKEVLYSWAGVRPRTARSDRPAGGPAVKVDDLAARGLPGYCAYTGGLVMTHRTAGRQISAWVGKRIRPSRTATVLNTAARHFPDNTNAPAVATGYPEVSLSDLHYASAQEYVRTLDDLMFRRVRLGWSERMACDIATEVARSVRADMGWSIAQAPPHMRGPASAVRFPARQLLQVPYKRIAA
jgi:glycerol-3-phosphate dehydrogenase